MADCRRVVLSKSHVAILARSTAAGPFQRGEPSWTGPPTALESDLSAVGLGPADLVPADRRLLQLLESHDLTVEVFQPSESPIWFALTKHVFADGDSGDPNAVSFGGVGFTGADAVRRCLGEFAEFCSWLHRSTDPHRVCLWSDLDEIVIAPSELHGFASDQIAQREVLNGAWQGYDAVPPPWAAHERHAWCRVTGLGHAMSAFAPQFLCYGRANTVVDTAPGVGNSNGVAAGVDLPSSQLAGLLELVERDAVGIWWYAACKRPPLALDENTAPRLAAALEWRRSSLRPFWLLDLTHDLGLPVVAALSTDENGRLLAMGSAARTHCAEAAEAAFLEMCQSELNLALTRNRCIALGRGGLTSVDRGRLAWLARATPDRLPFLWPAGRPIVCPAPAESTSAEVRLDHCLGRLAQNGLKAYALDLTRSDIGIPAAKVLVPGLCHIKPRFGFRRLVEVPVRLGWRTPPFTPNDLQRLPLLM
jgi:thiazole/oxazole-forming peptide maturase SagD family component